MPQDAISKTNKDENEYNRLESKFTQSGMRRSVFAALIVHNHDHPHLLLLQNVAEGGKKDGKDSKKEEWYLPGGHISPGNAVCHSSYPHFRISKPLNNANTTITHLYPRVPCLPLSLSPPPPRASLSLSLSGVCRGV
jgi:hypothetical protein